MRKLRVWAFARPRPWLVKYMLGYLVVGCIWIIALTYWSHGVAFTIAGIAFALYTLSLRFMGLFGPKARKVRSPR